MMFWNVNGANGRQGALARILWPALAALSGGALLGACGSNEEGPAPDPVVIIDTTIDNAGVGQACQADGECAAGLVCEVSMLGGRCTQRDCAGRGQGGENTCPGDALCVALRDGRTACVDACRKSEGEACGMARSCVAVPEDLAGVGERSYDPVTSGPRDMCVPTFRPNPAITWEHSVKALGISCESQKGFVTTPIGPTYDMNFTLEGDAEGFLIVPFAANGVIRALSLTTDTQTIDVVETYRHHNTRAGETFYANYNGTGLLGEVSFDWPLLFPYAPNFRGYVEPGKNYRVRLTTSRAEPCMYALSSRAGTRLDINFYFVNLEDMRAETAAQDADLQAVIARMNAIYAQANIELGTIRYFDVGPEAQALAIPRSEVDIHKLTAMGAPPGPSREDHLSVDVFLVEDLLLGPRSEGEVLGVSGGIPGAAGLHGNVRNGLIFKTSDIGPYNHHVGHIMAHEIGHFLGLRHTTEVVHGSNDAQERQIEAILGTTDPLSDTPLCPDIQRRGYGCPDFTNLMFPAAPPPQYRATPAVSPQQGEVLRINPLVR